jgi:hypothetical protein
MPGWPVMTILLIAAGTFVLLNLLRNREEIRRQRPPVRGDAREEGDDPQTRRQPPLTDLDRFLQEVHRRRQTGEAPEAMVELPQRPSESERVRPRPPVAEPVGRVARVPGRRSPRTGEKPSSRGSGASARQQEVIPLAIAVQEPASRSQVQFGTETSATVFLSSPPPVAAVRAVQSVEAPGAKARPNKSFLALLSSRQALRDVMILREIFDPPLCKRGVKPH